MSVGRLIVSILIVFSMFMPLGASAFHLNHEPIAASGENDKSGWTSFEIYVTGGQFSLEAYAVGPDSEAKKNFLQVAFFTQTGSFLGGASVMTRPNRHGVFTEAHLGSGIDVRYENRESTAQFGGLGAELVMNCCDTPPENQWRGTFKGIAWSAGEVSRWTWTLRGAGVSLIEKLSGTDTFMYTSEDFTSQLNVQANAQVDASNYGLRAQSSLRREVEVSETMVGFFGTESSLGVSSLTVLKPGGEEWQCGFDQVLVYLGHQCWFRGFSGANALGPGTYVFEATGAGDNSGWRGDIALAGADAHLP